MTTTMELGPQGGEAMLEASLRAGLADMDAGRVKRVAEVLDRLEAEYLAMAEAKGE